MNIRDTKKKINPDDRIIMSKKDILPLKFPVSQATRPWSKPSGLWYAIGMEWIDWVKSEMPEKMGDVIYKIKIDKSKMLILDSIEKMDVFTKKFGNQTKIHPNSDYKRSFIEWKDVSNLYFGIEISPWQSSVEFNLQWYFSWDVASGCIWDKRSIVKITKVS